MTRSALLRRLPRGAALYLDAVANMRPRQLLNRPRRLIPLPLLAQGALEQARWRGVARGLGVDVAPQSGPQPAPHDTGRFMSVGHLRTFPAAGFWSVGSDGLLFAFNLHAFADLAAYAAGPRSAQGDAFWSAVLDDWLRACAHPARPAWHPFPMSGRIIAWCAALSAGGWDADLSVRMRRSVGRQVRVLSRSVEHDIGGNHVLRNAVALTVAGACLSDSRLERRGLRLLERELDEQVLADGGHEERSPAYHRAVLADVDDVRRLREQAGLEPLDWLEGKATAMRSWLVSLAGPGGDLPLLNDAWEGPAVVMPSEDEVTDLAASGYVALRAEGMQAVLDVGPVAPRHLPPHAHADVLSFVLWADGERLIVDSGSFAYAGEDRDAFRATRAHNTVEVGGRDQCEFWGSFRAAFMPSITRFPTDRPDGMVVLAAEHDGYTRLAVPAIHRRTFAWIPGGGLVVVDRLIGGQLHDASSMLHLAASIEWDGRTAGPLEVRPLGDGEEPIAAPSRYAPFIGAETPATALTRRSLGRLSGWSLLRPGFGASLDGDRLTLSRPGLTPTEVSVR